MWGVGIHNWYNNSISSLAKVSLDKYQDNYIAARIYHAMGLWIPKESESKMNIYLHIWNYPHFFVGS